MTINRLRKGLATVLLLGALAVAMLAAPSSPAFVGHHCNRKTCRFFTSSYSTAIYFYDRRTCDQWKELSNKYLRGFKHKRALKRHYDRRLHPPC
jgi:hypothetical protein